MSKRYITTPIYYTNGDPHIGHAHTSVMGDILKRLGTMQGDTILLTTGTDEHGQKNQEAAESSGLSTPAFLERQSMRFRALFERLNVGFDQWVRTTNESHKAVVQEALKRMNDSGLLVKREYSGLYCVGCELFKRESDLDAAGLCPDHQIKPVEMREMNYFLVMDRFRPWLIEELNRRPSDWIQPAHYRTEILNMLQSPIEDLCISRPKTRVQLGIEFPFDPNYVAYVWFDALLNYIANIGWPNERYLEWWPRVTHLMAKDIIKTHCIYWPIMLKVLGIELPDTYAIHGFWAGEGGVKMSKTIGNVVDPESVISIVGADGLRFYLAKGMKGSDASISVKLIIAGYNADLANNIGNLYSRLSKFAKKQFQGVIPSNSSLRQEDKQLVGEVAAMAQNAFEHANLETIPEVADTIIAIATKLNNAIEKLAPWELAKSIGKRGELESSMYALLDAVRILFELAYPIIPQAATRALVNLGCKPPFQAGVRHRFEPLLTPAGAAIGSDANLFPRLEFPKS